MEFVLLPTILLGVCGEDEEEQTHEEYREFGKKSHPLVVTAVKDRVGGTNRGGFVFLRGPREGEIRKDLLFWGEGREGAWCCM